jgi:hypothetical protein
MTRNVQVLNCRSERIQFQLRNCRIKALLIETAAIHGGIHTGGSLTDQGKKGKDVIDLEV